MTIKNFVLIVGSMKCGTTTLFDLLAQHPEISPCKIKEPGFFAFEDRWAEGFEWYESLFDFDQTTHRYALDGSTDYTKFPFANGVVERLDKSAPRQFKLIYLVRDPIDRLESHARHTQLKKKELGQCLSPRSDHSLDQGISPVSRATSRYVEQMKQYIHKLEKDKFLVITMDDLSSKPREVLQKVWRFLDIPPYEHQEFLASNQFSNRRVIPEAFQSIRKIVPFRNYLRNIVGNDITDRFINTWKRPPELIGRFKFTEEERLVLEYFYRAEYELLNRLQNGEVQELSSLISELCDKT